MAWSGDERVRGWLARGGAAVAAGTRLRAWLTGGAIAVAVAAGGAGIGLTVAGVHSAARTALVLLFLAAGPTAAVAGLLRGFAPVARVTIAFATDIAILGLIAIIMLSAGLWSPTGGLLAVAGVTVACLAAQPPVTRRALGTGRALRTGRAAEQTGGTTTVTPAETVKVAEAVTAAEAVKAEPGQRRP